MDPICHRLYGTRDRPLRRSPMPDVLLHASVHHDRAKRSRRNRVKGLETLGNVVNVDRFCDAEGTDSSSTQRGEMSPDTKMLA